MKKKIWFILDDKQELENGKNKEQHKELGYQTKIGTCNTKKRTRTKDIKRRSRTFGGIIGRQAFDNM